jgi:hypothetical protein
MTEKQVKVNQWDKWRDVIGVRTPQVLPALVGGKVVVLPEVLLLEGGVGVSPENPNIQIRQKP